MPLPWIPPGAPDDAFPNPRDALDEPNGLLAAGGSLGCGRLVQAYRRGIFPWYTEGQPILWWSPDPRALLYPRRLRVSRSLRRRIRSGAFRVSLDTCFDTVTERCAAPRPREPGTWITPDMRRAYGELHRAGLAHSVEVWREGRLVGGLYGVSLGAAFFGESMFSAVSDASKVALVWLVSQLARWDFAFVDCQMATAHLASLGAEEVPRARFLTELGASQQRPTRSGPWRFAPDLAPERVLEVTTREPC